MLRFVFPAAAVLALTACATAAPTTESRPALISDRPDFTEATAIVPAKMVQAEVGYTVAREGSLQSATVGEVLVRAGLTPKAELRVAANSWVREREPDADVVTSGREDASLGFKLNLVEGTEGPSWRPELSVIAHTTIPTGSAAFRSSRLQPELKVLTAWTLSERVAFSSNVNIGRPYDGVRSFMNTPGAPRSGSS